MNQYNRLENAKAYIKDRLTPEELLAQLAEEAAELTHAALKLRRALDGTNPTPMHIQTAMENIKEEVADVRLLVQLLMLDSKPGEIEEIMNHKILRWQRRLIESE